MSAGALTRASGRYAALARLGWRQSVAERAAVFGRLLFFAAILAVFSRLWVALQEQGALGAHAAGDLIWYLALTEWIALGVPPVFLEIEAEVRSGDVAYRMTRPISYVGALLAQSAGDIALRMGTLAALGGAFTWLLAGGWPEDPLGLLLATPLVLAAAALALQLQVAIGLSAFWLEDCSPFYWIYQKALFVLGGLMLPLAIYPDWLRTLALATPFAAMLNGPGQFAFGFDAGAAASVALQLVGWNLVAAALLVLVYRRAQRVLEVNGG